MLERTPWSSTGERNTWSRRNAPTNPRWIWRNRIWAVIGGTLRGEICPGAVNKNTVQGSHSVMPLMRKRSHSKKQPNLLTYMRDSSTVDIGQRRRSISFRRLITYKDSGLHFPPNHLGTVCYIILLLDFNIGCYKTSDQSWPRPKVPKQSKQKAHLGIAQHYRAGLYQTTNHLRQLRFQ